MHQSSESIGEIATALAKAQAELTNPDNRWWEPSGRHLIANTIGHFATPAFERTGYYP
jgi:hypothetical protein